MAKYDLNCPVVSICSSCADCLETITVTKLEIPFGTLQLNVPVVRI